MPINPALPPNLSQAKMKIKRLLAMTVIIATPIWAKAATGPGSNQLLRKDRQGSVINVPLSVPFFSCYISPIFVPWNIPECISLGSVAGD